jgi:hypothetical protein
MTPFAQDVQPVAYFLEHDDDVARELLALAAEREPETRTELDLAAGDLPEELELLGELYAGLPG